MAGREQVVSELVRAFDNGIGDPNLSTILIGARGTGKTALMSLLAHEAQSRGWLSVNVSALPGMLDDIVQQARYAARNIADTSSAIRLKGIGILQVVDVEWERESQEIPNWRMLMSGLLEELNACDIGLFITVDEVHADFDELVQLISIYQHFVRENRKVALLMAGLPGQVSSLLQDKSVSFFRRACQRHLGRIDDFDIERAMRRTIEDSGKEMDPRALERAVRAVEGFPFMMQLVGYRSWEESGSTKRIGTVEVDHGIRAAQHDMQTRVLSATLDELSDGDARFLAAMVDDEDISRLSDIAERMGVSGNYAAQYRKRLIENGVIGVRGRGKVAFELPGMRNFIQEHTIDF